MLIRLRTETACVNMRAIYRSRPRSFFTGIFFVFIAIACSAEHSSDNTLTASFTYRPTRPIAGQAVQFTDTSVGDPTTWQWDFGDGTTSPDQHPWHTFGAAGSYMVNLTAFAGLYKDTANHTITVSQAGTITASSPSLADVSAAIASANSGDTVAIPAGTVVWSGQLVITKGIKLIGAGIDNTVITSNYSSNGTLIVYAPSNPTANEPFRLSGFSWNLAGKCGWLTIDIGSNCRATNIRIDHNHTYNPSLSATTILFAADGEAYGVADNNVLETSFIRVFGAGSYSWANFPFYFGSIDNFYFEDNTITLLNGGPGGLVQGEDGERYAFRHNIITTKLDCFALFDAHGNMGTGNNPGTMGIELYENTINAENHTIEFVYHRGGMGLVYNNTFINPSSVYIQISEEIADSLNPPVANPATGEPQHVSNSYYWGNRISPNTNIPVGVGTTLYYPALARSVPLANSDYWDYKTSFNGTSGIGIGVVASRPTTCTTGVGYWATDESILYRATATNTWTTYYKPYPYPHPLRDLL
jgi:PKD repeat protein